MFFNRYVVGPITVLLLASIFGAGILIAAVASLYIMAVITVGVLLYCAGLVAKATLEHHGLIQSE